MQPNATPTALRHVTGSRSTRAESTRAKIGIDVVAIPALMGEVRLSPTVKQHWLPTSPNTAATQSHRMSRREIASRGTNKEAIQNSSAPPATRNDTMSMPSNPWVIASLPSGDIKPQKVAAPIRLR